MVEEPRTQKLTPSFWKLLDVLPPNKNLKKGKQSIREKEEVCQEKKLKLSAGAVQQAQGWSV